MVEKVLQCCNCFPFLLNVLEVHSICNIIQEYSHEIKDKLHLFDDVNIRISDDDDNIEMEQISSSFPNCFSFHSDKVKSTTNRYGDIIPLNKQLLFFLLRFDNHQLQGTPYAIKEIYQQQFPLLKTFQRKNRLVIFNDMKSKRRKIAIDVPESFHLLCNKIHESIIQWYTNKGITNLFH